MDLNSQPDNTTDLNVSLPLNSAMQASYLEIERPYSTFIDHDS